MFWQEMSKQWQTFDNHRLYKFPTFRFYVWFLSFFSSSNDILEVLKSDPFIYLRLWHVFVVKSFLYVKIISSDYIGNGFESKNWIIDEFDALSQAFEFFVTQDPSDWQIFQSMSFYEPSIMNILRND